MRKHLRTSLILIFLSLFLLKPQLSLGQQTSQPTEERIEVIVTNIREEKQIEIMGKKQLYQKLEVKVINGKNNGKKMTVENGTIPLSNVQKYKEGDKLVVVMSKGPDGKNIFFVSDYLRRDALFWLFGIFIFFVILIGKKRGIASIVGMLISFFIIFNFLLPQILSGQNPIMAAIFSAFFIIPITFYLSHGINKKTTIAVIGTVIALIITGILSFVFVESARLTGFASEEASFLQMAKPDAINMKGLLLAGIIIGLLGILDDITISQAAIVQQLKETSPTLTARELFTKGMNVGTDHIASMVNTLVLVYTGAAMPLLLLFINNPHPFAEVINYEIIAEEVVRTLVASIGLILAVPITTFIAAYSYKK